MVHRQALAYRVSVNLLLWDPSQGHYSRCNAVYWVLGVWSQPDRAVNLTFLQVHQDGLGHVVEIVAESHDVRVDLLRQRVQALTAEHATV